MNRTRYFKLSIKLNDPILHQNGIQSDEQSILTYVSRAIGSWIVYCNHIKINYNIAIIKIVCTEETAYSIEYMFNWNLVK